jgi:hypothetical protein
LAAFITADYFCEDDGDNINGYEDEQFLEVRIQSLGEGVTIGIAFKEDEAQKPSEWHEQRLKDLHKGAFDGADLPGVAKVNLLTSEVHIGKDLTHTRQTYTGFQNEDHAPICNAGEVLFFRIPTVPSHVVQVRQLEKRGCFCLRVAAAVGCCLLRASLLVALLPLCPLTSSDCFALAHLKMF